MYQGRRKCNASAINNEIKLVFQIQSFGKEVKSGPYRLKITISRILDIKNHVTWCNIAINIVTVRH